MKFHIKLLILIDPDGNSLPGESPRRQVSNEKWVFICCRIPCQESLLGCITSNRLRFTVKGIYRLDLLVVVVDDQCSFLICLFV